MNDALKARANNLTTSRGIPSAVGRREVGVRLSWRPKRSGAKDRRQDTEPAEDAAEAVVNGGEDDAGDAVFLV